VMTLGFAIFVTSFADFGVTHGALAGALALLMWLYWTGRRRVPARGRRPTSRRLPRSAARRPRRPRPARRAARLARLTSLGSGCTVSLVAAGGMDDRPAHDLPLPLTDFVGREQEIADVARRIVAGARLVTLTGAAGGIGESRLAVRVAASVAPEVRAAPSFPARPRRRPGAVRLFPDGTAARNPYTRAGTHRGEEPHGDGPGRAAGARSPVAAPHPALARTGEQVGGGARATGPMCYRSSRSSPRRGVRRPPSVQGGADVDESARGGHVR
jgi:hypothetical protein